ncbi:seed maturation protein PM41 [Panicum miliaceum]|uniref:Seed maturation protein PM41 n=1 Tax=Panicum miliaceum TaxID=4540 RepID=A0A3L6RLD5_PANMI|nr:seed maturation protein PM41 [Panicum miliaceum]
MSGAQGAQPKGAFTATTYTSAPPAGGEKESRRQAPRTELRSGEDERGLPVRKLEDTVEDAAGKGGPVFGAGTEDGKPDLGVTGTGGG